jgi:uncharacterized protein (DUF2461 family)
LDLRIGDKLSKIEINPKKISRPLYAANKRTRGKGIIKMQTHVSFSEKQTSMFEWNPGIYLQFGHDKDANLIGAGLYMISSRQLKLMRKTIDENFDEFHNLMNEKKFKKVFPELLGETYKRFPKEYDESASSALYLRHKQFYIGNHYSRKEVIDKNFFKRVGDEIELTLPFLKWIRKSVGTYSSRNTSISG